MPQPPFSLLKLLETQAPLLGDGSKASVLQELGFPEKTPPFTANLSHPELVRQLHKIYSQAGAFLLRTNTEGAYREALESLRLGERAEAVHTTSMALLQEAAGFQHISVGSITGIHDPLLTKEDKQQAYAEQIIYLADIGVNLFMLSEFYSIEELQLALKTVRKVTSKEIIVHLTLFPGKQDSFSSKKLLDLHQFEATYIGIQGKSEDPQVIQIVQNLIGECGVISVLLDEPPSMKGEVSLAFQETSRLLMESEVAILAGGNYTTPNHIRALKKIMETMIG